MNCPDKRNALSPDMMTALLDALRGAQSDAAVKVIVSPAPATPSLRRRRRRRDGCGRSSRRASRRAWTSCARRWRPRACCTRLPTGPSRACVARRRRRARSRWLRPAHRRRVGAVRHRLRQGRRVGRLRRQLVLARLVGEAKAGSCTSRRRASACRRRWRWVSSTASSPRPNSTPRSRRSRRSSPPGRRSPSATSSATSTP